jgi:hypothetical protein
VISHWDEEGFSSCLACPCHRAVAFTPPKWNNRIGQLSVIQCRSPRLPSSVCQPTTRH